MYRSTALSRCSLLYFAIRGFSSRSGSPRKRHHLVLWTPTCRNTQLPGVHGGGARPSDDPAGEHVGGERRVAERAVGHAHVGDVGHVRPVRRLRLEPAFHEVGPAARALRRFGGDGRPAAAHAADSRFPHDVHHLVAADLGRIPAPRQQLGVRLAVPVHGHEEIGMDLEDAAGQRLVPGGHAADGPGFEHAVAARRDEPAVQRSGRHPAGIGPTLKRSLNSSM